MKQKKRGRLLAIRCLGTLQVRGTWRESATSNGPLWTELFGHMTSWRSAGAVLAVLVALAAVVLGAAMQTTKERPRLAWRRKKCFLVRGRAARLGLGRV